MLQPDDFDRGRIQTIIAVVLTTRLRLTAATRNVLVTTDDTGPPKASVVNVLQIITIDKSFLSEQVRQLDDRVMMLVEDSVSTVVAL